MIKKTITYTDYDGNERTEDFYFNLSKAELMEMEYSTEGGMERMLTGILATQDKAKMMAIFKEMILKSYGQKSPDGRRFIKSPDLAADFSQTEAYSVLFMELISDENAAVDFANGIIPTEAKAASNTVSSEV